jgi:hypothetical protein|tara:strand:+ start:4770 stop:5990 length:1221 start_codon:yes stop_codon:yes gene_type:complete
MKTIYCTPPERDILKTFEIYDEVNFVDIDHFDDTVKRIKHRKKVVKFEDITHPIFNPKENSVIIFDRRMIERDWKFFFEHYGVSFVDKLFDLWKKRNVKVLFNFAFYEAIEYETRLNQFITYDFPFEHLKLTDYPLFKDNDNFLFDRLYNLFHYFSENLRGNITRYPTKTHTLDKKYLFSSLQKKLRPHRLDFIQKLEANNLQKLGYLTASKGYFDEAKDREKMKYFSTDNSSLQNEYSYRNSKGFYNKRFEEYQSLLIDNLGENIHGNHTESYNDELMFDLSYVEISGETHVLFNLLFPCFTEKSYQPIFFDKMFLHYGANAFYKVLDELGGHNFKEEFLLDDSYFTTENPYEQIDMIIQSLKKLSNVDFSEIFIQSQDKIKENKILLIEYFKKIMKPVNEFILG